MKHLFDKCNTMHKIICVKINVDDTIERICGKWNLLHIDILADQIQNQLKTMLLKFQLDFEKLLCY